MAKQLVFSEEARRSLKIGYLGTQIVNHFADVRMNDQWMAYSFNNGVPFLVARSVGAMRRARDAGFDLHLSKPADVEHLRHAIARAP